MSLHFNWGRLDETCAEALRHLINKRLAEMVDHINSQNTVPSSTGAAVPAAMAAKPSTPQPPTVPGVAGAVASCPAGSHGAGAGKAEGSLHVSGIASRQEAVAGLTTIPGGVPNRATSISGEPISNLLPNSTWTSTASLHPSGTPVSNSGVALPGFAASAPAPTAAVPSTESVGGSVGVGGSSIAGTNVSLSGPAISSATPLHNCGYHGVGAAPPLAETNASNGVGGPSESTSLAGEPISVTASAANRSVLSHSSPGLGPTSSTAATSSAAAAADAEGAKKRIPPIVYLEVGRVEWGTSPPFIEIVAFENAIDGPPGSTRQRIPQEHLGRGGLFGGGRDGQGTGTEARGSSPYTVCRTTSMDTLAFSTAALDPGAGLTAVADSPSEGSHGLAPRLHTGVNTSHLFVGSHLLLDEANAAAAAAAAVGGGSGARADMPPCKPPSPSSHAQCSSHPEPVDSLASVLGPGGLYVRLHVTYGGAMHLSLNIAVQHEIRLGAVALRLSLPMMFYLANLDLDCYVCVNIKDSMCEVWLEPGPLSPSIVNRLSIIATVGGDDAEGDSDFEGGRKTSGTGDYGASSADFYSRFGGSSVSDVDGGEEGNGVYMNEHEVSQFVLHELRAVLRETLIAPHSIRIPLADFTGTRGALQRCVKHNAFMLSQSTTASAGTVTLPPSKVSTVGFVTSDGTTAAQCTPPIRSAALSATFSRSLPSPRRRPPQSTRPEEAIASRYLQRLGRTFIRSSLIHRIDPPVEPTNDVASTREGRSNIRKESLMHRESETQSELTVAPLRASIMADSSYVREDVKPTSTVSANRRRRQRSGPRVKSRSNALEGKRGRLLSRSRSLGRGGRHPNPMPYSTPRSPRSPSNFSSSISSSSVASLVSSECGSQATGPSSPRRHGKSATAAAIAAANADALVAKAAALMETAAPPHRRLRNENERFAQVLAQEQSKMLLLVGRHANLESDMVDLLEMADAASGKSQQEGLYTLSMPTAHTASHGAAVLSEDVTGPPRQNRGPRRSTVRMTSSPQNLQQLRHQLEKKGKEFLRNCGTNLDVTHLRELVEGLDNELTLMEAILEEELRDVEKSDSQKQPPSPTTGAAAAAAAPASPPRQSLRQRLQHARVRKEDPLEASSNFTRMGWLLESVDAELLTDFQQPQPAERSEQQTSETVTEVEDGAHRQSLLTVNEKMATMSTSLTLQQYSAKDILSHPTTPSLPTDTTATAGEAGKAEFDPRDLHRVSLTATISEPSMVPFSLSDPIHSESMRGSCEAASTSAVSGRQQQQQLLLPKGLQDTLALSPQVPGQSARLNLLSFMSDMLGKCQLEQVRPAGLRWGPSLSAPTPELDGSLASQLAALDHQALGRAEVANSGSNGAFSESHGVATGGGQVRDAAGGSASAARRSSSTFSGASADGASVTHSFGADNWSDQYSRSSDPRRRGESGPPLSISASNPKALLGAELRNLRPGLLHDLYELCALHNCVQLIEARRRELSKSAGKGDAEYVAEMEEKLAGHRRQIEAIQRAREEAARREAEEKTLALQLNPKDGDVRTTKRSKLGTPAGSNRGAFAEESDGSFYNSSAVLWMSLPRTEKQPPATSTPPHLAGPSKPTVQQPVSGQAETELLREILPDKGLVFTVVGVQRGHPNSVADGPGGTGSVTAAARADAGAMEMHPKETCNSVAPSRASGSNYFLYYELRVERPLSASPPQSTDRGGPTNGGPTTAASASVSTVASVSVARRRLMNLKMTSGAGASMVDEARGTVVKRSVTPGAPPQVLLRLTPAKPDAGVSYDQAFSFNAEDPSEGAQPQQQPQSWRDGWDVDSPVPGVFAFPLGGLGLQGKSRSSSLDSRKVRSAKGKKPPKGSGAHGGGSASKLARKGTTDKRKPTGSARLPGSASKSSRDHHAHSPNPSSPVSDTEAGEERGRGARASLPQSRDGFSKADEGSLTHPGQLPHTPPLSPVPRPIGEWGVPHAHAEMEAVEKNGVVLAVLQTSEGDDALAKASSADLQSGRGGTDLSAVQRLLAAIPDTEILDLMEGQRSSGAGGGSSEEDGGGGMRMGLMAADTGASLVNNMAEEILSQAMLDGSGGDGHVSGGGRNARGSSVRFDGIGEGVDREGFMDSAQMATKEEMGAGYSRGLSLAVEEGERSGSSHIGGVGADGHASLLLLATDSEGRPLSSTSQQQRGPCGSQRKFASKKPISFGEFTLKDAKSRAFPRVRRAESRAARPAITPAPFFTISSHSHPLLATEGAKYEGGPIRFEHSGDGAADGETTPSLPLLSATKPQHPLKVAGGKRPYRRRGAPESPAASAGAPGEPSVPSDHSELDSTEEGPNMPVPPPVVVVKGAPGRAKPYMMLPDQAAASSLGPSLRNQFALRPAGASPEGRISRENQRAQGDVRSTHSAAESASVSLQQHLTTENSVLPTMGAAAAAAADGETVSHVQKFLEAVKGEFLESSPSGGGFSSQAAGLRSKKPAGGAAGAALFTELSKLQEDARDLFMIDPERFDTVISELMGQAASALRQGFARCTPSPPPSSRGADGAVTSPAHDFPPGGRLPALCHGDSQGVGGTDRLAGTLSDAGEASLTQGKPLNASFAVSATLLQFEAAVEDWNNERGRGDEAALCVGETHPSGAFTRKRDSRTYSAGAGMSALPSRGLMSWLPGNPSQAPGAKPSGAESGIDEQAPLSPSFHSPLHVPRRSTHIFTKADTIAEGGGVLRSLSSADAVTEVERILYEQMKVQVLLRAIIAKMKEMWHTKQQTARAKYRERLVNRRERFMERAMAAAWAVERQRVVHLHKLIYLLDRQVGRVHGWLPHYSDSNVLMDASSFASLPRNMGGAALSGASGRTRAPLASWYRQRNQIAIDAAQDIAGGAPMNVCPRYLHYLPQRRMYCYMHLAKMRRMLPLRLVRAGIHKSHNRHLLLGYNKVLLENPEGQTGDSSEGTQFTGWPHRKLPRRRHDHSNSHATPFQVDRFDDMLTSGERARYRRRLQRTAAFQSVSKMYSPQMKRDADLPFVV